MIIDAFSTQPHYVNHLLPIWAALPAENRGRFYAAGGVGDMPNRWGIREWTVSYPRDGQPTPTLVAGYSDEHILGRPTIYLEHGAGQTYDGDPVSRDHPAYAGTAGHDHTVLFLSPNEAVAARWRARYPRAAAVAVGCPKLDRWHQWPGGAGDTPTVAITFHSDNRLIPETIGAWTHYQTGMARAVADLRRLGWDVLGHGHPRLWKTLRPWWRDCGAEPVEDENDVMSRADVLVGDNTSLLPEFASTGRPVVWMDAPWWRRNVTHGGRFWEWPAGQISVSEAYELPEAVEAAHEGAGGRYRQGREDMVRAVYLATDGKAAQRAVEAIGQHVTYGRGLR